MPGVRLSQIRDMSTLFWGDIMAAPVCSCGTQSKLVQFTTFSYHYCSVCRAEVGNKSIAKMTVPKLGPDWLDINYGAASASIAGVPPPMAPGMGVRPSHVALKGHEAKCYVCGSIVGELNEDLPSPAARKIKDYVKRWSVSACSCDPSRGPTYYRFTPSANLMCEYYLADMGWV